MTPSDWLAGWRGLTLREGLIRLYCLVGDAVAVSSISLIVVLSFFLFLLDYYGERHWLLAIALYLPGLVWLLPVAIFVPLCLVFCFRISLLWIVYGVAVVFLYLGYQTGETKPPEDQPDLTLVSNNVGNNARTSVDSFAAGFDPDILLFQEARPPRYYREKYPGMHLSSHGEFAAVSKLPIVEADWLARPRWGANAIGARYVVELQSGKRVVIYNIHMPTRRFIMSGIKGKGMVSAMLGRSDGYGSLVRTQNRDFFAGQIEVVKELIAQAESESLPVLLCGDFNIPGNGYLYSLLTGAFQDAFVASGTGFGYTFPGKTRNPLSLFRPWLRIDHTFYGSGVTPLAWEVEKNRPSQHRAIYFACELEDE